MPLTKLFQSPHPPAWGQHLSENDEINASALGFSVFELMGIVHDPHGRFEVLWVLEGISPGVWLTKEEAVDRGIETLKFVSLRIGTYDVMPSAAGTIPTSTLPRFKVPLHVRDTADFPISGTPGAVISLFDVFDEFDLLNYPKARVNGLLELETWEKSTYLVGDVPLKKRTDKTPNVPCTKYTPPPPPPVMASA